MGFFLVLSFFHFLPDGTQRGGKKPVSGKLEISVKGARDLDHALLVTGKRHMKPINETTVSVKVEGTQRARTHPSRTDRWMEDFDLSVDKANEIEITVYDKQVGAEHPVPVGLLWININDIVDALRKAKVQQAAVTQWPPAPSSGEMADLGGPHGPGYRPQPGMGGQQLGSMPGGPPMGPQGQMSMQSDGVEAWFAVEPAGAIALRLNFSMFSFHSRQTFY